MNLRKKLHVLKIANSRDKSVSRARPALECRQAAAGPGRLTHSAEHYTGT